MYGRTQPPQLKVSVCRQTDGHQWKASLTKLLKDPLSTSVCVCVCVWKWSYNACKSRLGFTSTQGFQFY